MLSDWIRACKDPDLFYLKALDFTESIEESVRAKAQAARDKVRRFFQFIAISFLAALALTVFFALLWLVALLCGITAAAVYQVFVVIVGLSWAFVLLLIALAVGTVEGVVKQIPVLGKGYEEWKRTLLDSLRVPAAIALVVMFLALLVARFPSLARPESIFNLVMIVAAIGLASFLGLMNIDRAWMKQFVGGGLVIALLSLIFAPYVENVVAAIAHRGTVIEGKAADRIGVHLERVSIDPANPPPFFTATGQPRYWFSQTKDGGYEIWNAEGHHPDSNEKLKPVKTDGERDKIFAWLRTEQQERDALLRQQAELQQKLDHEARLAKYFSLDVVNQSGREDVAVLVVNEDKTQNRDLVDKLLEVFGSDGRVVTDRLFKTPFISEGVFQKVFDGDTKEIMELGLSKQSDYLVLGNWVVTSSQDAESQGMVTVQGKLVLHVVDARGGARVNSLTLNGRGSGFSKVVAEQRTLMNIVNNLSEHQVDLMKSMRK
jgi:hypothetical protein